MRRSLLAALVVVLGGGCGETVPIDGSDASRRDASARDGGAFDAGHLDGGAIDGGDLDAGDLDAGDLDAGDLDGGDLDAGDLDAGDLDAGTPDAGALDASVAADAPALADAGSGGCVSGAIGTHAVRFRWAGSGSGSTAYVVYEDNELPDTARWRVSAASMSIGYRPVFSDVFLGEGGLELSGTAFIDVELSTAGLGAIRGVTIAVYGRSFATTSSGSFSWQTFDGVGATPSNSVANSAPYEWYPGDATAAFTPGDSGVLLRLRAGPSSNALIVSRVEICFDAS